MKIEKMTDEDIIVHLKDLGNHPGWMYIVKELKSTIEVLEKDLVIRDFDTVEEVKEMKQQRKNLKKMVNFPAIYIQQLQPSVEVKNEDPYYVDPLE